MKLTLITAAVLAVGALTGSVAQAAQYRMGLITPPSHQWTKTATAVAKELKAKSGGDIDLLVFPSGQLGNEAQMLQQLQTGALDFAFLTLGEFSNRDPNYGIFFAPYLVKDVAAEQKLFKKKTPQKLLAGVSKFGLVGLGYGTAGMRQIVMGDTVKSVSGLSGKKIRTVPLQPSMDFWSKLGAAPTPMPLPALYDAFANGQVDGMQIDFEGTWNSKYYDHAGMIIESNHMLFPMMAVASGRKWQAMPQKDKTLIKSVMSEQLDKLVTKYVGIDAKYLADLKTTDVPIKSVDRAWFGSAIDDWYAEWRKKASMLSDIEAEAKGL